MAYWSLGYGSLSSETSEKMRAWLYRVLTCLGSASLAKSRLETDEM